MSRLARVIGVCFCFLLVGSGCDSFQSVPKPRTPEENQLFGPVAMRLDTFTKVRNWTNPNAEANPLTPPDGIEAVVEFDDRFGDHTKAAGTILFELFDYRPGWPDHAHPARIEIGRAHV